LRFATPTMLEQLLNRAMMRKGVRNFTAYGISGPKSKKLLVDEFTQNIDD
jgi:hypothetical protein